MLSDWPTLQESPLIPQDAIPLPEGPLSLYIHIPFCRKACHYCDFYFSVRRSLMAPFVEGLLEDISRWEPWLSTQPIRTAYFGGGTPSWLPPALLEKIVRRLQDLATWRPVEWTLEANPEDITLENLHFWRDIGIHRLSLGVQTLSPKLLKNLGRQASADQTQHALSLLSTFGWENWSVDLLFAVPTLSISDLESQLRYLVETFQMPHISVYGLTIEPHTVLYKQYKRGRFQPVEDEIYAESYLLTHDTLRAYGYEHYEISNWAKPAYRSQHNLAYWLGQSYIGLGPSAHSYIPPYRWWQPRSVKKYLEYTAMQSPQVQGELLQPQDQLIDWWLSRIRLADPLPWHEIRSMSHFGEALTQTLSDWIHKGYAVETDQGVMMTTYGWLWTDTLMDKVLSILS